MSFNPIPTGQGRNLPLYERHVTKSGRNRVNIGNQGAKQQYYLFNFQNQFKEQHIVIELHCVTLKNTCIVF